MKPFTELDSPDATALRPLVTQDWSDQGRVLKVYRPWPGPPFWVAIGLLVLGTVAALATAPNSTEMVVRGSILGFLLLFAAFLVACYGLDRHRICEHGLVLGFRKRSRYVVPFASIDPGRVRVVRRMGLLGRRPEMPSSSPHFRVGVFGLHGVVLNGLDTAWSGWSTFGGGVGVQDAVGGSRRRSTPWVWWLLGTRRGEAFVADLEAAMVADGYAAAGLADRAIAQRVTIPWTPTDESPIPPRDWTDPVIGVTGPAQPLP